MRTIDIATLNTPAAALVADLRRAGLTLALAESCTGGLLSAVLTALPGASEWFLGGVIAYANTLKRDLLEVPEDVLANQGAVSAETAGAMAAGVRRRCGADLGLGITGIAGPGGGTPHKPVGTVFLGVASAGGVQVEALALQGGRDAIRLDACTRALALLRATLQAQSIQPPPKTSSSA